jgi:hypothetical protein
MISDYNITLGVTSIFTPDEILLEGLKLAGLDEAAQMRQPKSNLTDFTDRYGSSPTVLAVLWEDLQTTAIEQALVPPEKRKLEYFFMAHHFLRHYPTESERKVAWRQVAKRTQTQREWVWFFVQRIAALRSQKIVWPRDHVEGDDIWVCTVDGTMFRSWEIAGEEAVKDPANFSFKHQMAGFNAEVAVSIKESRCIWINGPGPAGTDADIVLYRKPGGLKEKLQSIGKKAIADGGYRGERDTLSTPNGHDASDVRKFKSRALKRHETFNNMLKRFKCLDDTFRHTAHVPNDKTMLRYKLCFVAVVVICQYQLENGSSLYNILVGDV